MYTADARGNTMDPITADNEHMDTSTDDSESWIGRTLIDTDDDKLGTIEAIYFDEQTGRPQWMAVKTGLLGTKHNFVPIAEAMPTGDAIRTPYEKGLVNDAPKVDPDEDLADDQVLELYRYYGLPYEDPADSGRNAGPDPILLATDDRTQAEEDMRMTTGHSVSHRAV